MADNNVEPVMSDGSEDSWTILDDIVHENQPDVAAPDEIDNEAVAEARPTEVEEGIEVLPAQPDDSDIKETIEERNQRMQKLYEDSPSDTYYFNNPKIFIRPTIPPYVCVQEVQTNPQTDQPEDDNSHVEFSRTFVYAVVCISGFLVTYLCLHGIRALLERGEVEEMRVKLTDLEFLLSSCRARTCNCPKNRPQFDGMASKYNPEIEERANIFDTKDHNDDSKHAWLGPGHEQVPTPEPSTYDTSNIGVCGPGDAFCNVQDEYEMCDVSDFAEEFGLRNAIKVLQGTFCGKDHIIRKIISNYQKKRLAEQDAEFAQEIRARFEQKSDKKPNEQKEKKNQKCNKNNKHNCNKKWESDDYEEKKIRTKHLMPKTIHDD